MIYQIEDIRSHKFSDKDRLFPDTNFWIDYYLSNQKDRWGKICRRAYSKMKLYNSEIYIDLLVLQEFKNVCSKSKKYDRTKYQTFKDFRNSPDYLSVKRKIQTYSNLILDDTTYINYRFSKKDLMDIDQRNFPNNLDPNDQFIKEICEKEDLTLITNDADFGIPGIRILTANRRLLDLSK